MLKKLIKERKIAKAKQLIDQYMKLVLELWKYGIHEKITNFTKNNGVINNKMVLLDFGELTNDTKIIIHRLQEKKWQQAWSFRHDLPKELMPYYAHKAEQTFTINNFKKYWKTKYK